MRGSVLERSWWGAVLVLAAVGGGLAGCAAKKLPADAGGSGPPPAQAALSPRCEQLARSGGPRGLSPEQRQAFYHLPEGSEHYWLPLLRALPRPGSTGAGRFEPFLARPERFGLLPDPGNPRGLPVGMAALQDARNPVTRVGFNCASCHVGELRYQGQTLRVDGSPGNFQLSLFIGEFIHAIHEVHASPLQMTDFLKRLAGELRRDRLQLASGQGEPPEAAPVDVATLREAYPGTLGAASPGQEHAELLRAVERYLAARGVQPPPREPPCQVSSRQALSGQVPPGQLPTGQELFHCAVSLGQLPIRTVEEAIDMVEQHLAMLLRYAALNRLPMTQPGPGRADAFNTARDLLFFEHGLVPLIAPVSNPHLWGLREQRWFHYDGNTDSPLERNLGQALGLGAFFDPKTHASTLLLDHIATLEELAQTLEPPCWPEALLGPLDPAGVRRGARLFQRHCAQCHSDPGGTLVPGREVGTDLLRLQTFNQPLQPSGAGPRDFAGLLGQTLWHIKREAPQTGAAALERDVTWRGTDTYLAKPLAGIWATAPYLHNGSVPTLRDLLEPTSRRPRTFYVGHPEYNPRDVGITTEPHGAKPFLFDIQHLGNSNAGHEYGTDLTDDEKRDLLEYLKSL